MTRPTNLSWLLALSIGLAPLALAHCRPSSPPDAPAVHPSASALTPTDAASAPRPAGLTPAAIDEALAALWQKEGVTPAPLVDDARFLRRLSLDLRGVIPGPEEVVAFTSDQSPDKRARAIDAMLSSDRFNEHWTNYWDRVLMGRDVRQAIVDRDSFRGWVRQKYAAKTPWNQLVYELLTATGSGHSDALMGEVNGAVNWLIKYRDAPADLSGSASRVFLGVQIQCAQCHDHKTEKWKQDDFRRLTACFLQTRVYDVNSDGKRHGELKDVDPTPVNPKATGPRAEFLAVSPGALDGTDFSASPNRRQALATWFTAPQNPWFARAFVNRMWGHLFGHGFVDPVDDFRESNPPVAPALLDQVAGDFVAGGYDVRRLLRTLASTDAYQRAAAPRHPEQPKQGRLWARYRLQPLGADELLDSLVAATRVDVSSKGNQEALDRMRLQMRNQLAPLFDVDEEDDLDDSFDGTIPQALLLLNGRFTSADGTPALNDILAAPGDDASKIQALYLRTLSRRPTSEETARWLAFLNEPRKVVRAPPSPPVDKKNEKKPGARPLAPKPATPGRPADLAVMAPSAMGGMTMSPGTARPADASAGDAHAPGRPAASGSAAGSKPAAPVSPERQRQIDAADAHRQAFEDILWALLNSSEFFFNH